MLNNQYVNKETQTMNDLPFEVLFFHKTSGFYDETSF